MHMSYESYSFVWYQLVQSWKPHFVVKDTVKFQIPNNNIIGQFTGPILIDNTTPERERERERESWYFVCVKR